MNIRNVKAMKAFARERLENAPAEKKVVTIYAGISLVLTLLVMLGQYLLGLQIDNTHGLGSMGLRSILSTVQTMLPILQMGITMCLGLGYRAAMLRVARGQYVSPNTLRLGFDRFWPLLRLTLMESLIISGAGFVAIYAACAIFVLTPLSQPAMEILMPLVGSGGIDPEALLDGAVYGPLLDAMQPVIWICLAVFLVVVIPIVLRYRMAEYVLIDKPGSGAWTALRESRKMTYRNCLNLIRVDLSLWWYHAGVLAVTLLGYGDQLLPMVGIQLPWSQDVSYWVFYGVYQVLQFGLCVWLRNRVETTYALAYDTLRPQETPQNGVVLGNIFQM